jgi:hypothetical protein
MGATGTVLYVGARGAGSQAFLLRHSRDLHKRRDRDDPAAALRGFTLRRIRKTRSISLNALLAMAAPVLERRAAAVIVASQREDKNNGTYIDKFSPL